MFQIRNNSLDHSSQMNLHFVQLEMDQSFRLNQFEKQIRLSPRSRFQCYFLVEEKRTLEICLARWCSSLTNIQLNFYLLFCLHHQLIFVQVNFIKESLLKIVFH